MVTKIQRAGAIFMAGLIVVSSLIWSPPALAAVDSCYAELSPNTAQAGSQTTFSVSITNTSASNIEWIHISRPSNSYKIIGISQQGSWTDATTGSQVTLTNNALSSNQNFTFQVAVISTILQKSSEQWPITVADNPSGTGAVACSGPNSSAVTGYPPNNYDNGVSSIEVNSITATSATISWQSDQATSSIVNYGLSGSYGSASAHDASLNTSHAVTLTGLNSSTGYHFQVAGMDSASDPYFSANNTFLTLQVVSGGTGGTGGTNNTGGGGSGSIVTTPPVTIKIPLAEIKETVIPTINLQTKFKRVNTTAPTVSGTSNDNVAVARIDYSLDDGKNWLPVDKTTGLGTPNTSFSFTPIQLDDGNYKLLVRAFDTSLNTAITLVIEIVIDKLPPEVGGSFIASGAQILEPEDNGLIQTLTGIDQKITMSGIGGVTAVTLVAKPTGQNKSNKRFYLSNSNQDDLWSGIVNFDQPGTYEISAECVDGAENRTSRLLQKMQVLPAARIVSSSKSEPISSAQITIYYKDPDSNSWVVWDGAAYSQQNPQNSNKNGEVALMIPSGTYYAKVTANGKKTVVSNIITLNKVHPITTIFTMSPERALNLRFIKLSLPSFNVTNPHLNDTVASQADSNELIGKPFPAFKLVNTKDIPITSLNLGKKPGVVTVLESWAPTANEQLQILDELRENKELIIMPVFAHESLSKVKSTLDIAGIGISSLADPDGILVTPLKTASQPTHYIIDRKGNIKKVVVGVLSKQRLIDYMVGQ